MLKLGEKICLAHLKLKHTEVSEDTCAKSVHAMERFFQVHLVNGWFTCTHSSHF